MWTCSACGKETSAHIPSPNPKTKRTKRTKSRSTTQRKGGNVEEEKQEAEEKVPEGKMGVKKKRSKNKGGKLAAMLAKAQKETKTGGGFGLDLADLMKLG